MSHRGKHRREDQTWIWYFPIWEKARQWLLWEYELLWMSQ